ncbi:MAG: glycosyltransferase, partial [Patescibacteria group bacterium]
MAERKRKIIFVVTKGNWGGVQRYVYDLATALPSSRWTPVVALGQGSVLAEKLAAAGIAYRPLPTLGRDVKISADAAAGRALYRLFKIEQPDIIHLNSSKAGLIGALAGRLAKVPKIIFTAHGWAFNEDRGQLARWGIKILHWLTIIASHQTIVVSEATKRQMARWPG